LNRTVIGETVWRYQGRELPINVTKRYGCYQDILKALVGQMDAMLNRHSRVLVFRLDLHLHDYTGDNHQISMMLRRCKQWLLERYQMSVVGHLWVRELESAKQQHYHLTLMLNGHQIRHPAKVIEWIEHYWTIRDEPKPYTPKSCYTMIHRGDKTQFNTAFYRSSYLAKTRGKGYKDATANNYSASRLS